MSGHDDPRHGYWLVERRDRGGMSEASSAVITALFAAGLDEVVAVTHPDNVASLAVAKRAGMREIGLSTAYYDTQTLLFRASSSDVAR